MAWAVLDLNQLPLPCVSVATKKVPLGEDWLAEHAAAADREGLEDGAGGTGLSRRRRFAGPK